VWTQDLGLGRTLCYAMGSDPGVGFNSGLTQDGSVRVTVIRNTDGPCWSIFMGLVREATGQPSGPLT